MFQKELYNGIPNVAVTDGGEPRSTPQKHIFFCFC
jgi:hypothetical protein